MARVAVIILNWNGEKLLREFLPSVVKYTDPGLGRIVVADNASEDDSVRILEQEFPEVELIRFSQNHGFAGGYNRAVGLVPEEIVVLLNSDVEVAPGWLEPLVALLDEEPGIAAVQPKILAYTNRNHFEYAGACGGFIDSLGFPFCRGRILNVTEEDRGQYDEVREVFWCSGAALCIRRESYLQAGGLDERFFAHMEEIDLCWRIRNRGYALKVQPASVVYHLGGGSLPMNHPRKLFLNYRNNLLMLYKNLPKNEGRRILIIRRLLDTIALARYIAGGEWQHARAVWLAHNHFRKERKRYHEQPDTNILKEMPEGRRNIVIDYFIRRKHTYRP